MRTQRGQGAGVIPGQFPRGGARQDHARITGSGRSGRGPLLQRPLGLGAVPAAQRVPGARQTGLREQRASRPALLPPQPFARRIGVMAASLEGADRGELGVVRERAARAALRRVVERLLRAAEVAALEADRSREQLRRPARTTVHIIT